jgi:hypothetical protein
LERRRLMAGGSSRHGTLVAGLTVYNLEIGNKQGLPFTKHSVLDIDKPSSMLVPVP